MMQHAEGERTYWTLPGGGTEIWESPEQSVLREVREETGLVGRSVMFLFADGLERCFVIEVDAEAQAIQGFDPELPADAQMIQGLAWFDLDQVAEDQQVWWVLRHLQG